ncbi:flavin-dependent monooxygenase [Gordonia desulfuricans]|uniref:Flavin-dependent monooxygenase n=1 Tax=Gordonia desulfuricans TaxID=89051 RepID=A0A7K3LPE0_9ACTN|nr:acyl-CoA dehydrogenase family protein [Gordonia desulfuricans]NDK90068.1 flavin-dependent monooxygenase [Gordonia desulfuricans]
MTATLEPSTVTWDSVLAELAQRRSEFHAQHYVPRDFVEKFIPLGVFRAAAPIRFGGEPIPPAQFLQLIERVARVDGSTGWIIAFASSLTYLGALPLDTQAEIYRDGPDIVWAGGLFPMQPAPLRDGRYVIKGRWKYASGCMGADYVGVGLRDESAGGKPRAAVLRPDQVTFVDDWDVTGMAASGSFDVIVENVEVPQEWTFVRGGGETFIDDPLYRYPLIAYQAQAHAAVGLGVAQAALDQVRAAGSRTGVTGAPPLAARAYYRTEFAKAYVALNSARSFYLDVADEVWQTVVAGDPASDEQIARMRLSAANIADTAADVVGRLCAVSGAAIINNGHPMQLLRQDAIVPQLHATLGQAMYDGAGSVLLGQEPVIPGFL